MDIVRRLIASARSDGRVVDVRIGALWTAVAVEREGRVDVGLAATQFARDLEHGRPPVTNAGGLTGGDVGGLLRLAGSESLMERCLAFAALNASLPVDLAACVELNAEALLLERARNARVALVGHFPFVPRLRDAAGHLDVLELHPQPGDLPADAAGDVIPLADVVAITGMTIVNGTFDGLVRLTKAGAFVIVLGASTPLSAILFEYGVHAVSGTVIDDGPAALRAVSEGANFRQIRGKRLLTMLRGDKDSLHA